ncbi:MAG: hypothetical protein CMF61_03550 [Magnetococcales bacterium]|nr:hypothetical protein [Magnetococcales bacterium]
MDFIARAGSVVDKWQRIAGVLLMLLIIVFFWTYQVISENRRLNAQYEKLRAQAQVYVVPGSVAGFYTPANSEIMLKELSYLIVNSLNNYTYQNLENQYREIQQFFNDDMLAVAQSYFKDLIQKAFQDERSSKFIPDQTAFKIEGDTGPSGRGKTQTVTIEGTRQYIIAGTVVEAIPMRYKMEFKQRYISKSNPFGFELVSYNETELTGKLR